MNREGAPLAERAFDGHASPVSLNDMLHDGESESRSAELAAAGLVDTVEPLEEARQVLVPYPAAAIDHIDHDFVSVFPSGNGV